MSGFWSSETMKARLPALIDPYRESRVTNCSYELSLGTQVFVTEDDKTRRDIAIGKQIQIPPGQFANLLTEETVSVPDDALGLISMKFTLKQPGLVNVSGFHVDPGYTGRLLFSVYNAGPQAVPITSGKPAFLLWYCSLDGATADRYDRPPRNEITDRDIERLGGEVFSPQTLGPRLYDLEVQFRIGKWLLATVGAGIIAFALTQALGGDSERDNESQKSVSTTTVATTAPSTATTGLPPPAPSTTDP